MRDGGAGRGRGVQRRRPHLGYVEQLVQGDGVVQVESRPR